MLSLSGKALVICHPERSEGSPGKAKPSDFMLTVTDCASATFLRFSAVIFCFNNELVSIFPLTKSSRSQAKIGVKRS